MKCGERCPLSTRERVWGGGCARNYLGDFLCLKLEHDVFWCIFGTILSN